MLRRKTTEGRGGGGSSGGVGSMCVFVGEGLIKEVTFEHRFEEVRMQAMGLSRGRML